MKKTGRYDASGLVEAREHIRAMEELATIYDKDHRFTAVAGYILHTATDSTIFQSLDL